MGGRDRTADELPRNRDHITRDSNRTMILEEAILSAQTARGPRPLLIAGGLAFLLVLIAIFFTGATEAIGEG